MTARTASISVPILQQSFTFKVFSHQEYLKTRFWLLGSILFNFCSFSQRSRDDYGTRGTARIDENWVITKVDEVPNYFSTISEVIIRDKQQIATINVVNVSYLIFKTRGGRSDILGPVYTYAFSYENAYFFLSILAFRPHVNDEWVETFPPKKESFVKGVGPSSLTWRPLSRSVILIGQTWFN